jgi:hypothetical protein
MLMRVLYVSVIAPGLLAADIQRLVASARRRNRQLDLTGALLICNGHFVQALEGREEAVASMMRSIAQDPRHSDLLVKEQAPITLRMFADWDMALVDNSQCHDPLQRVIDGSAPPATLLEAIRGWVNEQKEAPG